MASNRKGLTIVIMGVSGSGKSTIGEILAKALDCNFLDADDFHSQSNKEKMSKGVPLTEEDRIPWLEALRTAIRACMIDGKVVVLSCSALQKTYRDILRAGDPDHDPAVPSSRVVFVCLMAPSEVIAARLEERSKEGNHFMPASLLQSQLSLLRIDSGEGVITVDATLTPRAIVAFIKDRISL